SVLAALAVPFSFPSCERAHMDREEARWLSLEIERPEPAPAPVVGTTEPEPDAEGMVLQTFRVPASFFFSPMSSSHPASSLAGPEGQPMRILDPKEVFERAGIAFGPG